MEVGNIVRLKSDHHLSEIFNVNCIVHQVVRFTKISQRKPRYHIKTITGDLKWTWVNEDEVCIISEIRNDKLKELGI